MDEVKKGIAVLKDETTQLMSELSVHRMSQKNKKSTS